MLNTASIYRDGDFALLHWNRRQVVAYLTFFVSFGVYSKPSRATTRF